jgi:uncharacterized protein YcgL (UPF0745 family)
VKCSMVCIISRACRRAKLKFFLNDHELTGTMSLLHAMHRFGRPAYVMDRTEEKQGAG